MPLVGVSGFPVVITSAMRFAAADRQWLCERLMGTGEATASHMLEAQALRAARYWESFSECYSADEVAAGRELVGMFVWLELGVSVPALVQGLKYLAAVQACCELVAVQS